MYMYSRCFIDIALLNNHVQVNKYMHSIKMPQDVKGSCQLHAWCVPYTYLQSQALMWTEIEVYEIYIISDTDERIYHITT